MDIWKLKYTDGKIEFKTFSSDEQAAWFCANEGDHLLDAQKISENKG